MARANLKLSEEFIAEWKRVQSGEAGPVRAILVNPDAETSSIVLSSTLPAEDEGSPKDRAVSMAAVFDILRAKATEAPGSPLLALVPSNPSSPQTGLWCIISFTPETLHPRTKMMLAAARDDIKKGLDSSRFSSDYHVTDGEDLSGSAYEAWRDRGDRESSMTEAEKTKERVVSEFNQARALASAMGGGMMPAMASVPFKVSDDAVAAVKRLTGDADGDAEDKVNYVELAVVSETVVVLETAYIEGGVPAFNEKMLEAVGKPAGNNDADTRRGALSPSTSAKEEPRYFVSRFGASKGPVLIFYCSQDTAPKSRMAYSTAKACFTEALSTAGVTLVGSSDARDKEDLTTQLGDIESGSSRPLAFGSPHARTPSKGFGAGFALPGMAGMGPSSPHMPSSGVTSPDAFPPAGEEAFSKPSRPGKGGARVAGGVALPGFSPEK